MPSCIPPPCSEHVQQLVATMFTNPGTASNYVYYLGVGCSEVGDNQLAWDDYGVQIAFKGVKKINMELWGGPSRIAFLMTSVWVIVGDVQHQRWQAEDGVGSSVQLRFLVENSE